MSRIKKGNYVNGLILLDKPTGISSNDLLQQVKRLFNAKKAGHTGALDPLATGMLPICFGETTKFSKYLLDSDKRYRVKAKLGIRTDTSDADGNIVSERQIMIDQTDIMNCLSDFRGNINQIPSMFSALKHQGRPLYEYARRGINIEREPRPITIYQNKLCHYSNSILELEILCSKGTYIRTIIDDLGEKLGCGAHVIELRRLQVSNFETSKMISIEQLCKITDQDTLKSRLMPIDSPLFEYPIFSVTKLQAEHLLFGRDLNLSEFQIAKLTHSALYRLSCDNQFIGLASLDLNNNQLKPKRLISDPLLIESVLSK